MRRTFTFGSTAVAATLAAALVPLTAHASADAPVHRITSTGSMGKGVRPRAASTDGSLEVTITQGSAKVGANGSLTVAGTYTCDDPEGEQSAQLRVDLTADNDAEGSAELQGPCGVTDAPWTAVVTPDQDSAATFARGVATEAHATLTLDDDTGQEARDEAILLAQNLFVTTNAGFTVNSSGSATVSGTYGCSADTPTIDITAEVEDETGDDDAVGSTVVQVPCPATNRAWKATVNQSGDQPRTATRGRLRPGFYLNGADLAQLAAAGKRAYDEAMAKRAQTVQSSEENWE